MKKFRLLRNDYYQLAMMVAYMLTDSANDKVGFEAFFRRTNKKISGGGFYVFGGNPEVIELLEEAKRELHHPEFIETFITLVKDKLPEDKRDLYIEQLRAKWETLDKYFHYTVYPKDGVLYPFVPAVQIYGAKFIGQLLETPIINTINGRTGFRTREMLGLFGNTLDKNRYKSLIGERRIAPPEHFEEAEKYLRIRAKEFRNATTKILLEAGFRRACGFDMALAASRIALEEGWDGTSNTSLGVDDDKYLKKIGGTMAHSFVMGHKSELEAFQNWNKIFPNNTILTCTYDVIEAVKMIIKYNIKPNIVRIDVEPLDQYSIDVRKILDDAGWDDVEIFISGDLTPERLIDFEERKIPFDRCMAGTSYVSVNGTDGLNAEFVYKLVEFEKEEEVFYPEKKAIGKTSRAGLKFVDYDYTTYRLRVVSKRRKNGAKFIPVDLSQKRAWMGFYNIYKENSIVGVDFTIEED